MYRRTSQGKNGAMHADISFGNWLLGYVDTKISKKLDDPEKNIIGQVHTHPMNHGDNMIIDETHSCTAVHPELPSRDDTKNDYNVDRAAGKNIRNWMIHGNDIIEYQGFHD